VIDVQVSKWRLFPTILTLVCVAEHQVPACETHRDFRCPIEVVEMQDAWDSETTTYDGEAIVAIAHGKKPPQVEVVLFTRLVERVGRSTVEQDESTLRGGQLNRLEHAIENEDRSRQYVRHNDETGGAALQNLLCAA
jgi:hypothetical protein